MSTVYDTFLIFAEVWGTVFCIIAGFCALISLRSHSSYRKLTLLTLPMFTLSATALGAEGFRTFLEGRPGEWIPAMLLFCMWVTFSSGCMLAGVFIQYITVLINEENGTRFQFHRPVWVLCWLVVALFAVSCKTGWLFYVDDFSHTHLTGWFDLVSLIPFGICLTGIFFLLRKKGRAEQGEVYLLSLHLILALAMLLIQWISGSYIPLLFCIEGLSVFAFFNMQMTETRRLVQQEQELNEGRIHLMLSQIQPHFLYNTLDTIYHLCGKDPGKAQNAISDFSDYLRVNLDSLKREELVPLEVELRHTKLYLDLEKMSSSDTIDYEFDIRSFDFKLPVLSIQPMAENAIKHGVGMDPEGGRVRISVWEEGDYIITVSDNGVGFDPASLLDDGRTHIGIENVRQRLKSMCGGTLQVDSRPGEGTTVRMTIPKEVRV